MPKAARMLDLVLIICAHGLSVGLIITGSDYTNADGFKVARMGDIVICLRCGMPGLIITGSDYTITDGRKTATMTDICLGLCCPCLCPACPHIPGRFGMIITGSNYYIVE